MDICQTMLLSSVKMETPEDPDPEVSSFFGLTNNASISRGIIGSDSDMDMRDHLTDTFFSSEMSELDFDILDDLHLPGDFALLDDNLMFMGDDSASNSGSQTSTSDTYLDPSSISDSPPLTPPSPTDSTSSGSGSASNFSICPTIIKVEADSNDFQLHPTSPGSYVLTRTNSDTEQKFNPKSMTVPKSSRGRSASHDTPDVQALKRHIRMIRNRESACLSRKKKKEYLTGLESKIKELEIENVQLKHENATLRSRLGQLGVQVQPSNFSTLNSLNNSANRRTSNPSAANIKPKPKKGLPTVNSVAKIALLSLFCFMFVCFRTPTQLSDNSVATNHTPHSKSMANPPNIISASEDHFEKLSSTLIRSRRSVRLWDNSESIPSPSSSGPISREGAFSGNTSRSSNTTVNQRNERPIPVMQNNVKSTPRQYHYQHQHTSDKHSYRNLTFTSVNKCPLPFNQTEALRVQNDLKGIFGRRSGDKKKAPAKPIVYSLMDLELRNDDNKGLTVYDEKMRRYSRLLDQLHRREDTFYVVSLNVENQLLLSAKAHNTTSRPKMSFLMPWKNETMGGQEQLMQIDCEVTQVFNLNARNKKKNRS